MAPRAAGSALGALLGLALLALLPPRTAARAGDAGEAARGAYLARLADCGGCHTPPGGAPLSGGRRIPTPFGTVTAPNLTPDPETGLGRWSWQDFDAALRFGRRPDGLPLYPAHPYPYFARLDETASRELWAYLRTVPPAVQPVRGAALRFPFDLRLLVAFWNVLYFRPDPFRPDPAHDAVWNRGAFLVEGPGHCGACHTPKTALGGDRPPFLGGGEVEGWTAPPLDGDPATGLGGWRVEDIEAFLATGTDGRHLASGPMAEVVMQATSRFRPEDRHAIAVYLKSLPPSSPHPLTPPPPPPASGAALYALRCAPCHGEGGEGVPNLFPALRGNAAVAGAPASLLRILLFGARAAATPARPTGPAMPPVGAALPDEEVAAIASYVRARFGGAGPVSGEDVASLRVRGP